MTDIHQEAVDTLLECGGNITKAAEKLRIPRSTLQARIRRAGDKGLKPKTVDPNAPEQLRHQIGRLTTELKSEKRKNLDAATIRDHIVKLAIDVESVSPPKWMLNTRINKSRPGVPTLFCSDWHVGETVYTSQVNGVNEYSVDIFRRRVRKLAETAIELLKIISPTFDYQGIVLPLGGDMISGNIHDELTATNEINSMPSVLELYGVLVWLIETMLQHFPAVFVPCVTGNHGRDTRKVWSKDRHHTSFDWLLYCFLAKNFEGDRRVNFLIPDGPDAYYRIFGHRYLLTHGDQFRGGDGMIGALGPIIRGDHKKRSRNAQIDMEYDTMLLGHWHQYIQLTRLIVNGSLKGYDEYAFSNNFGFEIPQQALWLTHPAHGITYRMPVYVENQYETKGMEWVSIQTK